MRLLQTVIAKDPTAIYERLLVLYLPVTFKVMSRQYRNDEWDTYICQIKVIIS